MTRERAVRKAAMKAAGPARELMPHAMALSIDEAVSFALAFADAEAAAMRERAAKKADSWAAREEEEGEGGGRVWSASLGIAAAIRALPVSD